MQVVLCLGSNLGNKFHNIRSAINLLAQKISNIIVSPLYKTKAMLLEGSPKNWDLDFLNLAIKGQYTGDLSDLLAYIKQCEAKIGRINRGQWSPREIDIDIVITDQDIIISSDQLTVPHKALLERSFFLIPINDIAPTIRYFVTGKFFQKTIQEICNELFLQSDSTNKLERYL